MTDSFDHSFGVFPLKRVDGKWHVFLILHKEGFHWGFPKGHSDPGEVPKETASRELKEETGLKIEKWLSEDPLVEKYTFRKREGTVFKTVHYFPALVVGEETLQIREVADGKWISLEEADSLLTFKEARAICKELREFLKTLKE